MNTPLVSVIMPAYNAGRYIAESLESVLGQTYKNLEIIVIDDGSSDDTLLKLEPYKDRVIILLNETNQGIAAGRQRAIDHSSGEFLAFMDADDLWTPEKIELQINQFSENPDLDICFSHMKCFISPELPDDVKALRYCPPDVTPGTISATALVKKTSFDRVGPFNPIYRVGEFIDWFARAKDLGMKHTMIPELGLLRRIHETNTGVVDRPSRADYVKIVKAALDRKRSSS